MKHLLVALLVVVALGGASVASVGAPVASASTQNGIVLQLDAVQDFVERLDQFLEAIVDLLETLQQLFGG